MLKELVGKAKQMRDTTGNHIDSCTTKIAWSLTNEQLAYLAQETGNKRFITMAGLVCDDKDARPLAISIAEGFIRKATREE